MTTVVIVVCPLATGCFNFLFCILIQNILIPKNCFFMGLGSALVCVLFVRFVFFLPLCVCLSLCWYVCMLCSLVVCVSFCACRSRVVLCCVFVWIVFSLYAETSESGAYGSGCVELFLAWLVNLSLEWDGCPGIPGSLMTRFAVT